MHKLAIFSKFRKFYLKCIKSIRSTTKHAENTALEAVLKVQAGLEADLKTISYRVALFYILAECHEALEAILEVKAGLILTEIGSQLICQGP